MRSQRNQNKFQYIDNPGQAESRQTNQADDLRVGDQTKEGPQENVVPASTTEVKCEKQSNDRYEGSGLVFQPFIFDPKSFMVIWSRLTNGTIT